MPSTNDPEAFDEFVERALRGETPAVESFLAERAEVEPAQALAIRELGRFARRHRTPPPGNSPLPFDRLGEFVLLERLGRGGQGLVFLAEQPVLGRQVALKILRPELAGSEEAAARLEREARALATLRHPGIVAVHAFGEEGGVRYVAMDYLAGPSLEQVLREAGAEGIPLKRSVRWCADLARALACAHRSGVLHRDVKPANVRFDAPLHAGGRPVLLDFGLARSASDLATLTQGFAGSPHYAPPEQLRGERDLDGRADVYALGVVLYQVATGRLPFEAARIEALIARIHAGDPLPPRKLVPSLPRDLDSVILRAIETEPRRRYASADEFAEDLEAVLELRAVRARPLSRLERLRRAARRRPGRTAAISTACVAAVAFGAWSIGAAAVERERQREAGERLLASAAERLEGYRASRAALERETRTVAEFNHEQIYRYLARSEIAELDRSELQLVRQRQAWEATFYEVLDLLQQAQRVGRSADDIAALRSELYAERARQAQAERDTQAAELYRSLARASDPDRERAGELENSFRLTFRTAPTDARVQVFALTDLRRLRADGDARNVPVLPDGRFAELAGRWALEVRREHGALLAGDLVLAIEGRAVDASLWVVRAPPPLEPLDRLVSVDGIAAEEFGELGSPLAVPATAEHVFGFERDGQPIELRAASLDDAAIEVATAWELGQRSDRRPLRASVWREGAELALEIAPGAELRPTAAPLFATRTDDVRAVPDGLALESGAWLVRALAEGCEELRMAFWVPAGAEVELQLDLDPLGTTPQGFVRVDPLEVFLDGGRATCHQGEPFWIQEREVNAGEYLEFLNDPRTQAEIDASAEPIRFPRSPSTAARGGYWRRGSDGRFVLPPPWRADHPVLGVSWHDSEAYARWMSETSRARGRALDYGLPTSTHYQRLAPFGYAYPWGEAYRAHFARTCFGARRAAPGPAMRFPIDRTFDGAYDLAGSAFEWLDEWYDRPRGLRWQSGGSWARSDPGSHRTSGGLGAFPHTADNEEGLRLVIRSLAPQDR
jgi:formylglycine-generating enzyme required for sulfatase activity